MDDRPLFDPDLWCQRNFAEHRAILGDALEAALAGSDIVREVVVESGTVGREYDLTARVETDVGRLRSPLWSHARASIFCDPSIHPANRRQLAPGLAVRVTAEELRPRLAARFTLESRGLTVSLSPADGVERTWTAERSLFKKRTAVTREDRVEGAAEEDVRDLLARFYSGPSLRVVGDDGTVFLLPEATDVEGPLITLCHACGRWESGAMASCSSCGAAADVVVAARPPRR